jgi:hypothetical protein
LNKRLCPEAVRLPTVRGERRMQPARGDARRYLVLALPNCPKSVLVVSSALDIVITVAAHSHKSPPLNLIGRRHHVVRVP